MNFKNWLMLEMPINKFDMHGDWSQGAKRQYGFNKQDVGILTNPKAVEKIHKKWSNSQQDFDFYFVRTKSAYKHSEVGQVDSEWVKENLGMDIQPNPDSITIIFTNNTGAEKIPMTAWTIAHRLGHAIGREDIFEREFASLMMRDFNKIIKSVYDSSHPMNRYIADRDSANKLKAFAQTVGTMRSARQKNLRNFYEFAHELVAQYIITGKIVFNPLPKILVYNSRKWWNASVSDEELDDWSYQLRVLAEQYEYNIGIILDSQYGKMFVM